MSKINITSLVSTTPLSIEERRSDFIKNNPTHPIVRDLEARITRESILEFIRSERAKGQSYTAIGIALGVTRQRIHTIDKKHRV